ncbi:hypothetical protein BGX26_003398 [Mortierella sp. AD094]|nr:hypothetical protein BGX26_003398 [Mortierella sp. AD094]
MTKDIAVDIPLQAFRDSSTSKTFSIPARLDSKTGQHIILWMDIQQIFKNVDCVMNNGVLVLLLTDDNFEVLVPKRINYIPGATLEVVVNSAEGPYFASGLELDSTSTLGNFDGTTFNNPLLLAEGSSGTEHVNATVNALSYPINNNLVIHTDAKVVDMHSSFQDYQQLCNTFSQAYKLGQMDQATIIADQAKIIKNAIDEHFGDMKVDMSENRVLQEQIIQMQRHMEESQKHMEESQRQMEENQKQMMDMQLKMLKMQQLSLDRLAIIQSRVQAVLTQTYELHEYPIPRLFIILPKPVRLRDRLGKPFSNHFRLYFLCECGKHTEPDGCNSQHQVHLAKHEGYEIEQPTEFFDKYGSYILTLMEMFKYGITTASVIVPTLSNLRLMEGIDAIKDNIDHATKSICCLVDEAIDFLERRQSNTSGQDIDSNQTDIDKIEALEGADLRQLESYLKVKDEARVLGNLYRVVTAEGHVKWVCFDHYRETYREVAMQQLRDVVEANGGTFSEEFGRIEITVTSKILAKQFNEAMVKARGIQELDIVLGWDASLDDLRKFSAAVIKANIVQLSVDGASLTGPVSDTVNRGRRFDPIIELMSSGRIQLLQIKRFGRFLNRVSSSSIAMSPQLRILWIDSDVNFMDEDSSSLIYKILDNCPHLVELKLNQFSKDTLSKLMMRAEPPLGIRWRDFWRSDTVDFVSRIADRVVTLEHVNLETFNLGQQPLREGLLYALSRHGKKLRKLHLHGASVDEWLSGVAAALATRQEFPMLEFLDLSLVGNEFPKSCVPWFAAFISHPVRNPSMSSLQMSVVKSSVSSDMVDMMAVCKPLKRICLHNTYLESEDWETVIKAIDFSTIEELYLDYSNFSLVQFEILVNSITETSANNSAVPLRILNIENSDVIKNDDAFHELVGRLRNKEASKHDDTYQDLVVKLEERAPSVKIVI